MKETYSQLLQRPEWREFRQHFIDYRRDEERPDQCDDCGEDTSGESSLHVHHRRYERGKLPWEYSFDDMRLLCPDCHERIHVIANRFQKFIQTLSPHITYEAEDFLSELEQLTEQHSVKIAFAQSKNLVRNLKYRLRAEREAIPKSVI